MDIKNLISKLDSKYKNVMIDLSDSFAFVEDYPEEERDVELIKSPIRGKAYYYKDFVIWISMFEVTYGHFRLSTKEPQSLTDSCWSVEIAEKDIDRIETILTFG